MKKFFAALLGSLLIVATLVAPASAAKPLPKVLRDITAVVATDATEIHAGDTVTFTATTNAEWWKHELLCFQGDNLVMQGGWKFYPAGTASVTLTLSSGAYRLNPIGAECEVWVAVWLGYEKNYNGTYRVPEPLRFTLLP
jgi:hypothetical protein